MKKLTLAHVEVDHLGGVDLVGVDEDRVREAPAERAQHHQRQKVHRCQLLVSASVHECE